VFWVFILIALFALGYGAYALVRAPQLRVHEIIVTVDGHTVTEHDVLKAARIDPNANAWLLDTHAIEQRVAAIPYVASVRLTRTPPADVDIAVTERVPSHCVQTRTGAYTLDDKARVLQTGCARSTLVRIDAPHAIIAALGSSPEDSVVVGLLAAAKALDHAKLHVRSLARDRYGDLVATDATGVELRLGADTDLAKKAALVGPVRAATRNRPIRVIDLRAPETPTVEFR